LVQNTDNGVVPPSVKTFTQDTASKLNTSQTTIQNEIKMANDLTDKAKEIVIKTEMPISLL